MLKVKQQEKSVEGVSLIRRKYKENDQSQLNILQLTVKRPLEIGSMLERFNTHLYRRSTVPNSYRSKDMLL